MNMQQPLYTTYETANNGLSINFRDCYTSVISDIDLYHFIYVNHALEIPLYELDFLLEELGLNNNNYFSQQQYEYIISFFYPDDED